MGIRGWITKKLKEVRSKEDGIETLQAVMLAGLAAVILFFIIYFWNDWREKTKGAMDKTGKEFEKTANKNPNG